MSETESAPLSGIRVIDCSLLAPGATAMHLADLGAEVIKVEPPAGDYVRELTWPIIEGASLMHHHVSRGKKSLRLDLRQPEAKDVFKALVSKSDVVIEAMRPGALARRGLGYDDLKAINPALVYCCVSGYGMNGPYRNMPAHGLAFDSWAGLIKPAVDDDGFCYIPEHPSSGIHTGPMMGAMAICAALLRAKSSGKGACLDVAQADGAAYTDWIRSEGWKAYERPESEVTGNRTDNYERRAPGTAGMERGVRYQYYQTQDGYILFMASEQEFWRNFCEGIGRMDLYERWPGQKYGDHATGNRELQTILRDIFRTKTTGQWMAFGDKHNTALAPVNTPRSLPNDPHFQVRFPWLRADRHGADMLPFPVHFVGESLPVPARAPTAGEHDETVLGDLLGYGIEDIERLKQKGVFGIPFQSQ
ncbi:CoA transferase [Pseudomaricurvus alkylphenolicus]|uniref:CaiB/BaiF CoA transferase family protein n=1 Tax=Pseudomaricurvus alkylphenolicus TaxID=1306991 RepID=UPI00141DBC55|nr:CoA transferase [Pseudomaricurvus alkylphenolicus]NIB38331.1 CoA transferase [Pseudomaricurvus alkylphenolicus]